MRWDEKRYYSLDYYLKEKQERLEEIEKNEPWNVFLKNKIEDYYDKFINPPEFSFITKAV